MFDLFYQSDAHVNCSFIFTRFYLPTFNAMKRHAKATCGPEVELQSFTDKASE